MPPSATPHATLWPFTGRDQELAAVQAALARDGAVVLGGAAGVGKSRLARELVARVAAHDTVRVAAASASAREIPLGAFAHWLGDGSSNGRGDDTTALTHAAQTLRAGGPSSLLLVDDAHVLDATSATLLHQLATDHALRVIVTVRTGEPCPDAVTAMWKDGAAARIEIETMDGIATSALLREALGGHVDAQAARRLHDVTRGNVLWLRHLVEGELAAGRLAAAENGWQWRGDPVLSPALGHLVDARIGTLDPDERRVIELVSLAEPLGLGMLETLVATETIERVADRGLIVIGVDGARTEVRLAHPLYGEAARARLSVPRARRMRSELSRALQHTGARRAGDDLRRAVLALDGDGPRDPALLMLAARQAMDLSDFGLGERLLRAAVDAGGGFDARIGLALLLAWMLRMDETTSALADAMESAVTTEQRMRAVLARANVLFFTLDRPDDCRALLAAEERRHPGLPEVAVYGLLIRAVHGEVAGVVDEAVALAAREDVSSQVVCWASWVAAYTLALRGGASTQVRSTVARGIAAARQAPETAVALGNIGFADLLDAVHAGLPEGVRNRLAWIDEFTGDQAATWNGLFEGSAAIEAGRPRTSVRLLEAILSSFPGHGGGWSSWIHGRIAQGHALLGDTAAADAAVATARRVRLSDAAVFDSEVELARMWIAAVRGARSEATAIAAGLAADSRRRGARVVELAARHLVVRLGDRDQAGALEELHRALGSPRSAASARHARALADRDVQGLLAVADAFEACEMTLAAADAAAQAAIVAREHGDLPASAAAAARAHSLAVRCEGAVTPALRAARAPLPISEREREVAVLAAEGLTNREIAARLHVSVRTVESHVYRACTRLGLPDRASLAASVVGRAMP